MKMFDMHIHAVNKEVDPKGLLENLEKAGLYGCCVFSTKPKENVPEVGISFEERLDEVLSWSKGYEDRIFPVLWIHPYEENIIQKVHIAVEKGIAGFKMACTNFYVYEEKCLEVLQEIANLNKPVIFHTGILWDGQVSSDRNRPIHWEALINIKGLRFSMGHCSWPWVDECISLYGKFMNTLMEKETAEMFIDITPGTPDIYREELMTKLYTIGYDVGKNIMFGTDSYAHKYNSAWASKWLETDRKLMDKLGVSQSCREDLYYNNVLRFFGKTEEKISRNIPDTDDANVWSPVNKEVSEIIEKWYKALELPNYFDKEYYYALENIPVSDAITIENYDYTETDGKRNLLSYLFLCEKLKEKYAKKGISEEILIDTAKDLVIWTDTWSDLKNTLYLGELSWLKNHLSGKLFKLGRLQFCMNQAKHDAPEVNLFKGDNVIEVHIPACGPLDYDECVSSINKAKEFFAKHFPEYDYKCFTCHSWLLDETLKEILRENSNILKFQTLFNIVTQEEDDAILRYAFRWNTNRFNVKYLYPTNSFLTGIQKRISSGGSFYCGLGIINK